MSTPEASNPLVSCVMAVNKDDGFLDEAVQSVLRQTYANFEFIIVANNCRDDLWQKLKGYSDPRLRLFRTQIGQVAFNLNYGVNEARGKYIARMDADDVCLPDRFEKQVRFFNENPRVAVLGTAHQEIDEFGKGNFVTRPLQSDREIRRKLPLMNPFTHPTVMMRKDVLLKSSAYLHLIEDYELWLKLARRTDIEFSNLADVYLLYRRHSQQLTSSGNAIANYCSVCGLLFQEFVRTKNLLFLAGIFKTVIAMTFCGNKILKPLYRKVQVLTSRFET